MFRTFLNLFLIVIICFLASIMPLNSSLIDFPKYFVANIALNKQSNEIETISSSYQTNLDEATLYNPTNIEFIMTGEIDKGPFVLGDNHDIILEVYNNNNLLKKYVNTEFVTGLASQDNGNFTIEYLLDISQKNLGLKSGFYNFKLYSTEELFNDVKPYEIFVTYLSNSKYIYSKDEVENGYMYLTLYFPDKNYQYLVPISRKVPYTNKTIRTSINNLLSGPNTSLGLNNEAPIPEVPRIQVKNRIAYLYLPNYISKIDNNSNFIKFAFDSFINTLTSVNGVDSIKFFDGNIELDTFFNNATKTKQGFKKSIFPKIFLGLETDTNKFLLTPIDLKQKNMDIDNLVPIIFNSLKTGIVNDNLHKNLLPPVPNDIELLNYEHIDNKLILNLNNNFLNAYSKRPDIQKMMIDSILYSFTSIPKVNEISITVDGKMINSFNNIDLSKPLAAPKYINIEN